MIGGLPSVGVRTEFVEVGGLLSYGESVDSLNRRVAYFVDRILRGARPSDLPVELPSRFSLSINQRTARAFGLVIPNEILSVADKIVDHQ